MEANIEVKLVGTDRVYYVSPETIRRVLVNVQSRLINEGYTKSQANDLMGQYFTFTYTDSPAEDISEDYLERQMMSELGLTVVDNVVVEAVEEACRRQSEGEELSDYDKELLALPDEILLTMLSNMTYQDVGRFSKLSKKCYELANDNELWYHLYVKKFGEPSEAQIEMLKKRFPNESYHTDVSRFTTRA